MENKKRYVWLSPAGRFSNSWDEKTHEQNISKVDIELAKSRGWRLIEYICLTDENFEFYDMMRLLTKLL